MKFHDIVLRPLRTADLAEAARLSAGLGWPHRMEDWALCLALGRGVAADDAGRLVGTAMWWPCGATAGTLGMVLVAPERQRAGIGRRMMETLLAGDLPERLMLHATEAGAGLYERLGFRQVGMVRQHQGVPVGPRHPRDTPPLAAEERAAVMALDREAFGVERTALMTRLLGEGACLVDGTSGQPTGFALRRPFGRGTLIGPVVAADEGEAIVLVGDSLGSGFHRLDIPAEAARLAGWLERIGLAAVDTVITMVRGAWPVAAPDRRGYALASQAFG